MTNSIILIGMPGSGKSTLGVLLAKELGLDFVDTDVAIQVREHKTLQQILNESDHLNLRRIEESVLMDIEAERKVIATGGSAVYAQRAMQRLKKAGVTLYLNVRLEVLENRINNFKTRGIAMQPGQSFESLFEERNDLYQRYADIVLDCNEGSAEQQIPKILTAIKSFQAHN